MPLFTTAATRPGDDTATAGASRAAVSFHYDIGTDLYRLFLDSDLVYSAARWAHDGGTMATLENAQAAKIRYHLDMAGVGRNSHLLDIGCGWGALLKHAVSARCVARAVGLTLSEDQIQFVRGLSLPRTEVHLTSYEKFQPTAVFDAIVCIGAFEHFARPRMRVADKIDAYRAFFRRAASWLPRGGMLSLQTICWAGVSREAACSLVPEAVFPESDLPFVNEIFEAAQEYFEPASVEMARRDYILTLKEWLRRLESNKDTFERTGGPDRFHFYRTYLRNSIVGFQRKRLNLCRVAFCSLG